MQLDARARTILQLAVEAYIDDAEPVSSSSVARRDQELHLSPATIRNVMVELERLGLLWQPHPSAGRVPTEAGLRVYLDGLMNPKLRPWDRTRLDLAARELDPSEFPAHLGQLLAGLAGQMVVVAVPRFLGSRFREVGLVRCAAGRFLAYFVSPNGLVQQKLVEVEFDLVETELTWIQNFLNERLAGRTLEEVRGLVRNELSEALTLSDSLRTHAFELCQLALPDPELKLFVEGAAHLSRQPEFADVEKLRALLRTVDNKALLLKLLDRILDQDGVRVVLSSEHEVREVPELACVGSTSEMPSGGAMAIGVVGPVRMDYVRLVPMVQYASQLFQRYWQG